jgi:hypothetical protein
LIFSKQICFIYPIIRVSDSPARDCKFLTIKPPYKYTHLGPPSSGSPAVGGTAGGRRGLKKKKKKAYVYML